MKLIPARTPTERDPSVVPESPPISVPGTPPELQEDLRISGKSNLGSTYPREGRPVRDRRPPDYH